MTLNGISNSSTVRGLSERLKNLGLDKVPTFPKAYPELNPVDIYRAHLTDILAPVTGVDPAIIYPAIQWPLSLDKGDLVLPVPALRVKGKKPDELANMIADKFPDSPLVQKPVVASTFVAFFFKPGPLSEIVLPCILRNGLSYGFNAASGLKDPNDLSKGKKKMVVEFSSPNIAKPFHAGHLRSTIIGGFLSNLYQGSGWDVERINYLGDWGKQYGVLAVGFQRFGNEAALRENPTGHLYNVYVKISALQKEELDEIKVKRERIMSLQNEKQDTAELESKLQEEYNQSVDEQARKYFKRMVDGEPEALALWEKFRHLSIEKMKATYARLNIYFDDYSGESQVKNETMDAVAKSMEEQGVSEVSEGAVIVDLTKYNKKLGKAMVTKKDGTSLYLTRDIGAMFERYEKYHFDKMIYVVSMQQNLHFGQLFKIVEVIGRNDIAERCEFVNFGIIEGMSTRKGTAKFLDDILEEGAERMHEVMRANDTKYQQVEDPTLTAYILGISAVMVQDMTGKRINNYPFDMDRVCSFEGDTGPYLQYSHARLCSITRKAEMSTNDLGTANWSLLKEKQAVELVRSLAQWPDVVQQTLKTLEPVTVLTYLFKMAHALNSSYDHLQVVKSKERLEKERAALRQEMGARYEEAQVIRGEEELKKARMALYTCAKQVLSNGMRLLGLSPVERM